MPSPRHRQSAVRQRRRKQRRLALVGLAIAVGTAVLLAAQQRDPDRAELSAERRAPDAVATTVTVATTTTTTATTATTAAPDTTTATAPPTAVPPGWYAVIESAPKDAGSRDALRSEVARYGARGMVIDTDDYRTGDGQAPEYLPAPGVLAAAVGPFSSLDEVQTWCAGHDGDRGCHARQLLAR
jgi:hypothetical protein